MPWAGLGPRAAGSGPASFVHLLGLLGEAAQLSGDHQEVVEQDVPQEGQGDEGTDPQQGAGAGRPPHGWAPRAAGPGGLQTEEPGSKERQEGRPGPQGEGGAGWAPGLGTAGTC